MNDEQDQAQELANICKYLTEKSGKVFKYRVGNDSSILVYFITKDKKEEGVAVTNTVAEMVEWLNGYGKQQAWEKVRIDEIGQEMWDWLGEAAGTDDRGHCDW